MPRTTIVAVALLIGLLAGIALEPDSGTAASVGPPDITGLSVGANHAKPLPKPLSVTDILRSALTTVLLVVLLLQRPLWVSSATVGDDDALPRPVRRALARARRGPPATL